MLYNNITVDDELNYFETPRGGNKSGTASSTQVMLGSDILQCQHSTPTYPTSQKIPPSGNEYIFFQTDRETVHVSQCTKSRLFTKLIESIIGIESFQQQFVILKGLFQSE